MNWKYPPLSVYDLAINLIDWFWLSIQHFSKGIPIGQLLAVTRIEEILFVLTV